MDGRCLLALCRFLAVAYLVLVVRISDSSNERYYHAGYLPVFQSPADSAQFIRIQWVELINNIRYRVVAKAHFEKLLYFARLGVSTMVWRLICTFNSRAQLSERARLSTSAQLLDAIFNYITKITVYRLKKITS